MYIYTGNKSYQVAMVSHHPPPPALTTHTSVAAAKLRTRRTRDERRPTELTTRQSLVLHRRRPSGIDDTHRHRPMGAARHSSNRSCELITTATVTRP